MDIEPAVSVIPYIGYWTCEYCGNVKDRWGDGGEDDTPRCGECDHELTDAEYTAIQPSGVGAGS